MEQMYNDVEMYLIRTHKWCQKDTNAMLKCNVKYSQMPTGWWAICYLMC